MRKGLGFMPILGLLLSIMVFTSCATIGGASYEELAAQGVDVFAGKNWNAPEHNNMYDRWEFNSDGTFHFWHVHEGTPLDRGVYHYEAKDGILTVTKEGDEAHNHKHYAYTFSGKTVTLTPVTHQDEGHGAAEHTEHDATEHGSSGGHQMGALPDAPVTFTRAK